MNTMPEMEKHPVGIHGMLIVGEKAVYLSHLPMWMPPHNFQVILQATFNGPNQPQDLYVKDRQTTQTKLYTLQPLEKFALEELVPTDSQGLPSRSSFKARIWRNHFEDHPITHPGQKFEIGEADVHIEKVVYFHKFLPQEPTQRDIDYVFFGQGEELFAAHRITTPPNFDQVLSIRNLGGTEEFLETIMSIVGRADVISNKLTEGEQFVGSFQPRTRGEVDWQFVAGTEWYFETEDLEAPAATEGTRAFNP